MYNTSILGLFITGMIKVYILRGMQSYAKSLGCPCNTWTSLSTRPALGQRQLVNLTASNPRLMVSN